MPVKCMNPDLQLEDTEGRHNKARVVTRLASRFVLWIERTNGYSDHCADFGFRAQLAVRSEGGAFDGHQARL